MKTGYAIGMTMLVAGTLHASVNTGETPASADMKMKSTDGSMVSINDVKGEKGTLVVFTCNTCPFVIAWQDRMVGLANTYQKKGIGVVFINSNDFAVKGDDFASMQQMAKKNGYQFPYVADETSDVARNFGATKTPDVFLFNAAGKLAYHGAIDDNGRNPEQVKETYLKDALDAVVAGQSVKIKESKAVGCGIKFR